MGAPPAGRAGPGRRAVDRIAGLLMAGFGLALLLRIVPAQVETVDYGWLRPETLPNALAAALVPLGLAQALCARGADGPGPAAVLRAGFYLGLAALAAWAMARLGFVWVAPAMMLALMLLIGERRPLWLGLGAGVLPAAIWAVVVFLLGRTLPG